MCLIKFVTTNSHVTSCEETLEVLTKKAYDYNPDLVGALFISTLFDPVLLTHYHNGLN